MLEPPLPTRWFGLHDPGRAWKREMCGAANRCAGLERGRGTLCHTSRGNLPQALRLRTAPAGPRTLQRPSDSGPLRQYGEERISELRLRGRPLRVRASPLSMRPEDDGRDGREEGPKEVERSLRGQAPEKARVVANRLKRPACTKLYQAHRCCECTRLRDCHELSRVEGGCRRPSVHATLVTPRERRSLEPTRGFEPRTC